MYRILFVMSVFDSTYNIKQTIKRLSEEKKDISIEIVTTHDIDKSEEKYNEAIKQGMNSDYIFVCCHGGFHHFKKHKDFIHCLSKHQKKFFFESGIQDDIDEFLPMCNVTRDEFSKVYRYFMMRDAENIYRLTLYLAHHFGYQALDVLPIKNRKWEGIYNDLYNIDDLGELKKHKKPIIGILFHIHDLMNHDTEHVEMLMKSIEDIDGIPVPLYTNILQDAAMGQKGIYGLVDRLLDRDGNSKVDTIINLCSYSLSIMGKPGDGTSIVEESVFRKLNIPVIKAITTFETYEMWEKSVVGVDGMTLVSSIYFPEFDGQIMGVPVATKEMTQDEFGTRYMNKAIPDRIETISSLAMNWAKLRYKANKEKKIGIILHNMPPRNDMIGCAHCLDTPESVYNVVNTLKENDFILKSDYENGQEIINQIIAGLSNEMKWLNEKEIHERAIDEVSKDLYQGWFEKLDSSVQEKMIHDWEEPLGSFMVYDNKIPIPGILNGNVFIGLQPPRALDEKAEESYHSTDMVCPHQYIAFYKWLKHVFKADIILHVGTHGTVEWLPGKEKGLSKKCYPDICMLDFPHLYIYHIAVTGEGIQAKRRSKATLLSHSIPSMQESKAYGDIEVLESLIDEYNRSKRANVRKIPIIKEDIWKEAETHNYHLDLKISKEEALGDFDDFLNKLHIWLGKIKNSLINDGLHIFGHVVEGKRYKNLLRSLVRIKNGDIPPLNLGVAESLGYDYERLIDEPLYVWDNQKNSIMVMDDIIIIAENIMNTLEQRQYQISEIPNVLQALLGDTQNTKNLIKTLEFLCLDVKPRVDATTDELKHMIKGVNGEFVDPGPSGNPTRGRVNVLPTGRNFYAIDPRTVPSRAAWSTGKKMADDLLNRYLKDEGKYPESIAIIMYSGETMKTNGDDVAEILCLMGVKPVWIGTTDRIQGLEVIPLDELKRPRIDVISRISGLFRDTFPNLIELLETAVHMVAELDEPEHMNFIKKHVSEEVAELLKSGVDLEVAFHDAALRVFGCPPGTYGAGTDIAINSKKWETVSDIGNMFINWSSHGYSTKIHGDKKDQLFRTQLSKVELTVKNESSMEIDMLDSDDFFVYHGGLISAVTAVKGERPKSYVGNSANPERTEVLDINEETARIMRARVLNPKWFDGLKEHGYKGAQEVSALIDYVFGWDATSGVIEDWMYERVTEEFVLNEENRQWIQDNNKFAMHYMTERLLEAIQRQMWQADDNIKTELMSIYLDTEGHLEGE